MAVALGVTATLQARALEVERDRATPEAAAAREWRPARAEYAELLLDAGRAAAAGR
jgi:hypothetical protein